VSIKHFPLSEIVFWQAVTAGYKMKFLCLFFLLCKKRMRQLHPFRYSDAIDTFAGGKSTVYTGKSTFSLAQFQVGPASLCKISMALAIHKCPVDSSDVDAVTTG
jgi:hypothetical protein